MLSKRGPAAAATAGAAATGASSNGNGNGNGKVSAASVVAGRAAGLDPAQTAALDEAWDQILRCVDDDPKVWNRSVQILFLSFDRQGDGHIDVKDLTRGLTSFGVRTNPQQVSNEVMGEVTLLVSSHQQTSSFLLKSTTS